MKRLLKATLGRSLIRLGIGIPSTRRWFKKIGLRCSQNLFGPKIVSIPGLENRPLRLTHVDDSYLSFQLFWHGLNFYEPISRALLKELLQPGATFLDLGAHVGFFSLTAALSVPNVTVIAFEPNPKNFRTLQANRSANSLAGMACEPMAISDRTGTAPLFLTESDMSASLMKSFQAQDTRQIGEVSVRTTTLDDYLAAKPIKGRLVIKADIEGHEPAFFRGAAKTLSAHKPDIILEVLYEQPPEVVNSLKSMGYHFYPITDRGLSELDAPGLVKRFPFLFLNHLLSTRPRAELETLFERVGARIAGINLLETSKHFCPEEWPDLWSDTERQ